MTVDGALRFARFAVPPNGHGHCGPARQDELRAYRAEELAVDAGLRELAVGFEGAWPYLELLAGAARSDDPLDDRVVEAYWIGNDLCTRVGTSDWGLHLTDRFRPRLGRDVDRLTSSVGAGAVPHHSFHVFNVYPWVGLLREGRGGDEPLRILRDCHIGWATVIDRLGDDLLVEGPGLSWDSGVLGLRERQRWTVWLDPRLVRLGEAITTGSSVAIHWREAVDVLTDRQRAWLEHLTRAQLAVANRAGVPVL